MLLPRLQDAAAAHEFWRELFYYGPQNHFLREEVLVDGAALLFHVDRLQHVPADPIFPPRVVEHRQWQWFESVDHLASYLIHVLHYQLLWQRGDIHEDPDVLAALTDWLARPPANASADEIERFRTVHEAIGTAQAAIGGPRQPLQQALESLPWSMGSQRIFADAGKAMAWLLAELPPAEGPEGPRPDPRPTRVRAGRRPGDRRLRAISIESGTLIGSAGRGGEE